MNNISLSDAFKTAQNVSIFPQAIRIVFPIFWSVSLLCSVTGSVILLCDLCYRFKKLPPTEVLITNLVILDFILVLYSILYMIPMMTYDNPRSKPMFNGNTWQCRLYYSPVMITSYGSAMTLAAIAIVRYIKISSYHLFSLYFSRFNIIMTVIGIWIFSIICSFPPVHGFWGKLVYYSDSGLCGPNFGPVLDANQITYNVIIAGLFYVIVNSITGYSYYKIYRILSSVSLQYRKNCLSIRKFSHPWAKPCNSHQISLRREQKTTITLFVIFIGNLITYGPAAIAMFMQMLNLLQATTLQSCILLTVMYINSVVNPLILIASSYRSRHYLINSLGQCLRCRRKSNKRRIFVIG